jgi:hypothetical protein
VFDTAGFIIPDPAAIVIVSKLLAKIKGIPAIKVRVGGITLTLDALPPVNDTKEGSMLDGKTVPSGNTTFTQSSSSEF